MRAIVFLLPLVLVAGLLWLGAYLGARRASGPKLRRPERIELEAKRALVDDLQRLAYDHLELLAAEAAEGVGSPSSANLARIITDEIRTHENRLRRELS